MQSPSESVNSILTPEIQRYVFTRDWPTGLEIRLAERKAHPLIDMPAYIQFILFRDNFNSFDGEDRYRIAMTVKEVMEKIRADGVPIFMEVKATRDENVS